MMLHLTAAAACRSVIGWRKIVLLNRAVLLGEWDRYFPHHDFGDLRLNTAPRIHRPTFEDACDAAVVRCATDERKARHCPARSTPQVVVEAIVCEVREGGLEALNKRINQERLARCDEAARQQINARIAKLFPMKTKAVRCATDKTGIER